jgi:D-arabinose 1-dehydrogenase-like Zn-dependent alcohol dehydrogenase
VFFGGTLGSIPQLPPAKVFWKQLSLLGSTMGTEQDFEDMLRLVTEKSIVPVVDEVFPLADGEAALRRLDAGAQFGKVVLKIA